MKHETDNGGDAYDVGVQMAKACIVFMVLCPIGIVLAILWVSL